MKNIITVTLVSATLLSHTALAAELPSVISGGVGQEEQARMEQLQNQYNTKLVFTGEGGFYLADVVVSIRDRQGKEIVNGTTDGPILLTELKPGRYTVEASTDGFNRKRNISVGESLKTYHFQFPVKDSMKSGDTAQITDERHLVAGNDAE